ncbi:hypothetical protein BGX34_004412, partial [Mortierella sp. NVP85]
IAHHPGVVLDVVVEDRSPSSQSTSQVLDSMSMAMDSSTLWITEVDDDNQVLAAGSSSEELSICNSRPVYNTHSSQCVALHQGSSMPNTHHSIHNDTSTLQMQRQIADLQQQIAELQQAQRSGQRAQQQTDEFEQPILPPEHQTQQQWQKQADMTLQKMQDTVYQYSLIQYRIQEQLSAPLEGLRVPRFFMVLPRDTGLSDGQRDSSSLTFRLHFLCEGISYSPIKGTKETCDIHMTNHPGYDIKDPKEFFGKYGSYILTTMYMIKYGATAPGFVVPPLAHSKLVARVEENLEYPASIKKNIDQLMDIAISFLEDTPSIDGESSATSHWSLKLTDHVELKSYLDDSGDGRFPRDLHRVTAQERHCTWMCREHRYEWIIHHLKDVVNAVGGAYNEDTKITIKCGTENERLYDAMAEFCKAQTTDDLSLSADIGQLSLTASASQAGQEVSVKIDRLRDLTMDGVKFIQHCNLTKLTVRYTPEDTDEDRLVDILNQGQELKELHIRCNGERSYAIIHLVTSTRETAIQEGRTSALHTFKVTDERWDPFDYYKGFDGNDHIVSTVTFFRGSAAFDMDTDMKMQYRKPVDEGSPISNFIREYGWSLNRFSASWQITDHLATLLDNATEERGSRLSHLTFSPFALSTLGLEAMDQVIKRSQSLTFLWLSCVYLEKKSQSEKALLLLGRYGERLNRLTLNGNSMGKWLVPFARLLPTANSFPRLDHIYLLGGKRREVPPEFIQWLIAVAQDRLQPPVSYSNEGPAEGNTLQTRKSFTMLDRLRNFTLSNVTLLSQDWEILIKAIDLSELKELHLGSTNFSSEQLDLLLERIATADPKVVSLKVLGLGYTELLVGADKPALRARILMAAPELSIQGL